ncbi:hypothetical protein K9B33_22220 [Sphingobium sp. 3R8]|uniref:hypothetical protein n=1 Tax=Sphingobium sp. 3R8 TaxID=2874921 RepID=UPI001CCD0278|nr:hypothetical protein [Sphingobium sp. 3R8]MBZ9650251.1 hypothetical protein [Sphingobium sp. 3R8]
MAKFIALYIGSVSAAEKADYAPTPDDEAMWSRGMAAWGQWMSDHADAIVDGGGPLGATLRISPKGIEPHENRIVGYVIVEADSHEAAARLFSDHPHFAIMPGDSVEILECLAPPSPAA